MEELQNDPLLYPGKTDEETLKKMPPTIIWEAEFDFYITEAFRFCQPTASSWPSPRVCSDSRIKTWVRNVSNAQVLQN